MHNFTTQKSKLFFGEETANSSIEGLERSEAKNRDSAAIRRNEQRYDIEVFRDRLLDYLCRVSPAVRGLQLPRGRPDERGTGQLDRDGLHERGKTAEGLLSRGAADRKQGGDSGLQAGTGILKPGVMGSYVVVLSLSRVLNLLQTSVVMVLFPEAAGRPDREFVGITGDAVRINGLVTALCIFGDQAAPCEFINGLILTL